MLIVRARRSLSCSEGHARAWKNVSIPLSTQHLLTLVHPDTDSSRVSRVAMPWKLPRLCKSRPRPSLQKRPELQVCSCTVERGFDPEHALQGSLWGGGHIIYIWLLLSNLFGTPGLESRLQKAAKLRSPAAVATTLVFG